MDDKVEGVIFKTYIGQIRYNHNWITVTTHGNIDILTCCDVFESYLFWGDLVAIQFFGEGDHDQIPGIKDMVWGFRQSEEFGWIGIDYSAYNVRVCSSTEALNIARNIAEKFGVKVSFEAIDISNLVPGTIKFGISTPPPEEDRIDTVIMNPPFGAQKQHADRIFLTKALEIGTVTYSLHLRQTRDFIQEFTKQLNAEISHEENYLFPIKHTFAFHSLPQKSVDVTLFRILKATSGNR